MRLHGVVLRGSNFPQYFKQVKNYFRPILNVHSVNDIRQTEMHVAEPLLPDPNPLEIESAIEKLKKVYITTC
jgi:hypothetical protein